MKRETELSLTYNAVEGINHQTVDTWINQWKDKADLLEVWRPHNWVNAKRYRKVQQEKIKTCGRPFNGPLQIQVDGIVNMCCFDYDGLLALGDLKHQALNEIFSSSMFDEIIRAHTSGEFKCSGLICADCDQRNRDKSDVMIYNSRYDIKDRVEMISTTYRKIT